MGSIPSGEEPASRAEIAKAIMVLTEAMPPPKTIDAGSLANGYLLALHGLPLAPIVKGITRFMSGGCDSVNPKYCPHPPELAKIVREGMPKQAEEDHGRLFAFRRPASAVLERNLSREWARSLVDQGLYPRGCIWTPGPFEGRRDIGDLYAPDLAWRPAVRILTKEEVDARQAREDEPLTPEQQHRAEMRLAQLRGRGIGTGKPPRKSPAERAALDAFPELRG